MVVSGIGFGLFKYGRSQRRLPHSVAGVVLMAYPYAVSSLMMMIVIGAALIGLLWVATLVGL